MKLQWLNSPIRWKDSFNIACAIFAIIEAILTILEISLKDNLGINSPFIRLLVLLGIFLLMFVAIFIVKYYCAKKGVSLNIRGIKVNIQQGDIFEAKGWKIIAFNEYYDTTVDDIVIAHNTLNGIFIDRHVEDINDLKNTIATETDDDTKFKKRTRNNRYVYPLGRIIRYKKDFMLLAFTHFENNEAHLTQKDYEDCLRVMWIEICRTYANRPVFIPLWGSGITRFEIHKSNFDLLKCMLCTLRTSTADIKQPITILLTEETMQDINIYEIKGAK